MAVTKYHNITGSTGVNVELLAPGAGVNNISSIVIANTHASNDATISVYIQDNPSGGSSSTFYLAKTVAVPSDTSIVFEEDNIPFFSNSISGHGLYITVGSSDTVDVLLNI